MFQTNVFVAIVTHVLCRPVFLQSQNLHLPRAPSTTAAVAGRSLKTQRISEVLLSGADFSGEVAFASSHPIILWQEFSRTFFSKFDDVLALNTTKAFMPQCSEPKEDYECPPSCYSHQ